MRRDSFFHCAACSLQWVIEKREPTVIVRAELRRAGVRELDEVRGGPGQRFRQHISGVAGGQISQIVGDIATCRRGAHTIMDPLFVPPDPETDNFLTYCTQNECKSLRSHLNRQRLDTLHVGS